MNDREMTATKAQIDTATDTGQLIAWYDHAEDMATNILATIEARDLADLNEDEWFYRASDKYAHCKVAMKRVLKRLHRLGYEGRVELEGVARADMRDFARQMHALRTRMNALDGGNSA